MHGCTPLLHVYDVPAWPATQTPATQPFHVFSPVNNNHRIGDKSLREQLCLLGQSTVPCAARLVQARLVPSQDRCTTSSDSTFPAIRPSRCLPSNQGRRVSSKLPSAGESPQGRPAGLQRAGSRRRQTARHGASTFPVPSASSSSSSHRAQGRTRIPLYPEHLVVCSHLRKPSPTPKFPPKASQASSARHGLPRTTQAERWGRRTRGGSIADGP